MIKRRGPPELPAIQGEVIPHLGSEKLGDIFLNLANHVDRDLSSIHTLLNGIYLAGWQKSRMSLNKLQEHFRNNFLNDDILPAFTKELVKINEAPGNEIQQSVNSETWEDFKQLNEHIDRAVQSLAH